MFESRRLYIIVEGSRGFHLSYWEHHRTNYRPFCSQTKIKFLQEFYKILLDVRVLKAYGRHATQTGAIRSTMFNNADIGLP